MSSLASQFKAFADEQDDALVIAKWLADHDPRGRGTLIKEPLTLSFTFTDGSHAVVDAETQEVQVVQ